MPIGPRSIHFGPRFGPHIGLDSDLIDQVSTVTRDATSGILCPATAAEWTTVLTAAGLTTAGPSALWLCQEASGNLADSIGSFTLTAGGTAAAYAQSLTGWSRKGISGSDGATTTFSSTSASLPDPSTTSMFSMIYAIVNSAPAAQRSMTIFGTGLPSAMQVSTVARLTANAGGSGSGLSNMSGSVRPLIAQHDVTNVRYAAFSNQDKVVVAKRATTGKSISFPLIYPGSISYGILMTGAAAELTNGQINALLQVLGWSPPTSLS